MTVTEMMPHAISGKTCVFHQILMATDLSSASHPALSFGLALAKGYDANLSVVHVLLPDWRYEMLAEGALEKLDAHRRLDADVDSLHPERPVARVVRPASSVGPALLAVVKECGADVLLMGTHGRDGLSKLAVGSVAEELVRTAPVPVMTVGPKAAHRAGAPSFQTVVFATDFGAGSTQALPLVLRLVHAHDAKLVLVHMIPPVPAPSSVVSAYAPAVSAAEEVQQWEEAVAKQSRQNLRNWIAGYGQLEHEPEYVVGTDFLVEGILAAAVQYEAGLIVMGSHQSPSARISAHFPWSAVHHVIHDAPCPVLTVAA